MKNLIFIALLSCFTAAGAEMVAATNHIVLASGSGANKVLLNHLIESARKRAMNSLPSSAMLADFKETTVVFQDKPIVQVIFFKSANVSGFLFEYRIENGKATLLKETEGPVADPESGMTLAESHIAGNAPAEMKLADAPEPVRREINTELSNGPLKKIERISHNRREIFQVTLQQKNGTDKVIYLNADGTYVKDK